jgi:hypothetical protein
VIFVIFVGMVIAPKARRHLVERRVVVASSRRSRPKAGLPEGSEGSVQRAAHEQ